MKKILTILLALCLLVALAASFAVSASADAEIAIGQRYEWNDQTTDAASQKAWRTGKGVSPDGLWTYKVFVLATEKYMGTVISTSAGGYAWAEKPEDTGIGFCRVRNFGSNFHPGEAGDIVKVFTCPSGGTVTLESILARTTEYDPSSGMTPSSFAVYVADGIGASKKAENRVKVYPVEDDYELLTSATEKTISVDIDVKKGQLIMIHIGAVEANQGADGVNMSNTVTYIGINDDVAAESTDTDDGRTIISRTDPTLTLNPTNNAGSVSTNNNADSGSSTGLIIGVVAGVAVVAAVVVVLLLKKKKAE